MNKWIWGVLICCLPCVGWAQVYKCVKDDQVSFSPSEQAGWACRVVRIKKAPKVALASGLTKTDLPESSSAPASSSAVAKPTATTHGGGVQTQAQQTHTRVTRRGSIRKVQTALGTTYTNVGTSGVSVMNYAIKDVCFACGHRQLNFAKVPLNLWAYKDQTEQAAEKYGVEEALIRAVMHAESNFRPTVVSPKGASGLMQLIPSTAKRFGVSDRFDAQENIEGGVKYLAWLMKRYNSNITYVAAAYNAGEGAVDRAGGIPPYEETQVYVKRVEELLNRYRKF